MEQHTCTENDTHYHNEEDATITIGEYKLKNKIGEGSFGCVFKAVHVTTKIKVATKLLAVRSSQQKQTIIREVMILRHLQSQEDDHHIVHLIEVIEISPEECPALLSNFPGATESNVHSIICIVMEYIEGGDLLDHVQQRSRLREEEAAKLFHQLIAAVHWCHSNGVIHRDIKLENLMMVSRNFMKLVDFGLGQFVEPQATVGSFVGSVCYSAPEVFKGDQYDGFKADIWSCGVVLYAMVTGEFPWDGLEAKDQVKNIIKGRYIRPNVSADCYQLIKSILKADPATRATIPDILNHPWMQKYTTSASKRFSAEREIASGKQELTPTSSLESPRMQRMGFASRLFKKKQTTSNTIVECSTHNTCT